MLCFGHITVTAAKNAGEKESKGFKESQSKPGNGNSEYGILGACLLQQDKCLFLVY